MAFSCNLGGTVVLAHEHATAEHARDTAIDVVYYHSIRSSQLEVGRGC
jgi:hypothetical protein